MVLTKGKTIMFCMKCKWKESFEEVDGNISRCPKCNSFIYSIFQYKHYKDGKLIDSESGITDYDENFFGDESLNKLKRIFNKAFKIWEDHA